MHQASAADRDLISKWSNKCSDTTWKMPFSNFQLATVLNTRRVQGQTHPPVNTHRQLCISAEPFQLALQLPVALGASCKGSRLKPVLRSIFSHIQASSCNNTGLTTPWVGFGFWFFWLLKSISQALYIHCTAKKNKLKQNKAHREQFQHLR